MSGMTGNFSLPVAVKENVTAARPEEVSRPPITDGRAMQIWLIAVQVAVVALTAIGLGWARVSVRIGDTEIEQLVPPALKLQALLGVLALVAAVIALVPAWRRGIPAALICATMSATACWLSVADRVNSGAFLNPDTYPWLNGAKIPTLFPIVLAVAVVLKVWDLIVRGSLWDQGRFGVAAGAAGAFIVLAGLISFCFFNTVAPFNTWYHIDGYLLMETLAVALLYPVALWLGALGVRATNRLTFLPGALAVLGFAFLAYWRMH
jgi:hypothetical protein